MCWECGEREREPRRNFEGEKDPRGDVEREREPRGDVEGEKMCRERETGGNGRCCHSSALSCLFRSLLMVSYAFGTVSLFTSFPSKRFDVCFMKDYFIILFLIFYDFFPVKTFQSLFYKRLFRKTCFDFFTIFFPLKLSEVFFTKNYFVNCAISRKTFQKIFFQIIHVFT